MLYGNAETCELRTSISRPSTFTKETLKPTPFCLLKKKKKTMSVTIERSYSYNTYTVTFNRRFQIHTVVTSHGGDVIRWISETTLIRYSNIIGLDVEWLRNGNNPVAVLQLCAGLRCLVFQILHADHIPNDLFQFLLRNDFQFVGLEIHRARDKLWSNYRLRVVNIVEIRALAEQVIGWNGVRWMGLKRLTAEVMHVDLDKPSGIRLSRWDLEALTFAQIKYACIDAFLSHEIARRLYNREF